MEFFILFYFFGVGWGAGDQTLGPVTAKHTHSTVELHPQFSASGFNSLS